MSGSFTAQSPEQVLRNLRRPRSCLPDGRDARGQNGSSWSRDIAGSVLLVGGLWGLPASPPCSCGMRGTEANGSEPRVLCPRVSTWPRSPQRVAQLRTERSEQPTTPVTVRSFTNVNPRPRMAECGASESRTLQTDVCLCGSFCAFQGLEARLRLETAEGSTPAPRP